MGHHHHHDHNEHAGHGHSHGLTDTSILRSREGVRAVSWSLLVLFIAAGLQATIYLQSHSLALLADLIHNFGDALTAIPLGLAFLYRSKRGEKWAGYCVILAILVSACIVLAETLQRFLHPQNPTHLWALALAGLVGFLGNEIAAMIRWRAGKHLNSPALIADGNHARIDGLVSLGVVASAGALSLGLRIADPIIGLFITALIIRITWQSWETIRKS